MIIKPDSRIVAPQNNYFVPVVVEPTDQVVEETGGEHGFEKGEADLVAVGRGGALKGANAADISAGFEAADGEFLGQVVEQRLLALDGFAAAAIFDQRGVEIF